MNIQEVNAIIKEKSIFIDDILNQITKVIVGQNLIIEKLLLGVLTGGHILIEGVPGLAKTLSIKTLSETINTKFQRIQFTPDLLPADLIGTLIYNQRTGEFITRKGPIFANIILADEINRAPAKVQSALLEAMQEKQVTIGETTYKLDEPFLVLATQNPIEQEGTYPLPEAQVDRFMFKLKITYPDKEDEIEIIKRMANYNVIKVNKVVEPSVILESRKLIDMIYIDEKIISYIVDIIQASRTPEKYNLDISNYIEYGASPRASIYLTLAAKANAFLKHRGFVTPEDVKLVGPDILRHRIILTYEAEAEEITTDDIIKKIFDNIEVP
ncbi:MAG TPA: MoxR family ATPase [bacterium]|nr:MoxR family ATPase [bacterium]HOL46683.1 MoxR family ATPase [bacterium]HPQ18371.1 MoxR family ATPase [bacterium]